MITPGKLVRLIHHRAFIALILLSTASCTIFGSSDIPERREFWEKVVIRVNSSEFSVEKLLEEYSEFEAFNPDENGYLQVFEDGVKYTGFPCSHWRIGIKAELDENGSVSNAKLEMTGACA